MSEKQRRVSKKKNHYFDGHECIIPYKGHKIQTKGETDI